MAADAAADAPVSAPSAAEDVPAFASPTPEQPTDAALTTEPKSAPPAAKRTRSVLAAKCSPRQWAVLEGTWRQLLPRPDARPHASRLKPADHLAPGPGAYDANYDCVKRVSFKASILGRDVIEKQKTACKPTPAPGAYEPHESELKPPPGSGAKAAAVDERRAELRRETQRRAAELRAAASNEPKSYAPRVTRDGKNVGVGHGVGSPAFSVLSRTKLPTSYDRSPGPTAYGYTTPAAHQSSGYYGGGTSHTGSFSPRAGGMTGTAAPPLRATAASVPGPGPGQYSPRFNQMGVSLVPGGDAPSWQFSGRWAHGSTL